ncbi:MAG: peptidoglycan DD-metalloendopeptidase family protein [Nitriliruptor sp.]|uniref:murein hydrolase activator EnvC n=1 Tax=Nitriliruptor sp. TaxID=2448056 RepID=UPI0034A01F32
MQRRWSRSIVAVAALGLLSSTAWAQTTDELHDQLETRAEQRSDAQQRLAETRVAQGDARERLAEADRQLDAALVALERVEQALTAATEARDAALAQAERLRAELALLEEDLAETEAELATAKDRFDARVAGAFKRGASATETAIVGQLLSATDISEALSTAPFLTAVMDADRQLVAEVQELVNEVQIQRGQAAQLRVDGEREAREAVAQAGEVEARAAEARALSRSVAAKRAEREAALEALRDDRQAIEGHLAGLDAESSRIGDQLAAIAREQAAQAERQAQEAAAAEVRRAAEEQAARDRQAAADRGATSGGSSGGAGTEDGGSGSDDAGGGSAAPAPNTPPTAGGGWTRPVGGSLTSPYGPRWGRNHNGVDLAGSVGTTVVSSQPGTVVSVTSSCHPTSSFGCGGGFGNHVVVSHAAGMATIYAHLSTVSVGAGQWLNAGEGLGGVGNSGNSYGSHLHFEVREGGAPRDPCGYIAC